MVQEYLTYFLEPIGILDNMLSILALMTVLWVELGKPPMMLLFST